MQRLIRKIHMYIGLLSFSILLVYGIAGLTATFETAPEQRRRPDPAVRFEPFEAPPLAADKEVADLVYRQIRPSLAAPVPPWALRRDGEKNLVLEFYSVNGVRSVSVLEKQKQLRIETERNSIWRYFDNLHSVTPGGSPRDLRVRLWAWYNEFAIFTLLGMTVSGIWLWILSRPRHRIAQVSLAAGLGVFVVLFVLTR